MTTTPPPQQPPAQPEHSENPAESAEAPRYQPAAYAPQPPFRPSPSTASTVGATNTYALLAVILGFLMPVAGIVFGHMGLSQIKRTGDAGRGLALTGLIVGYAYFAFIAVIMIIYVGIIATMFAAMGSALGGSDFSY